MSFLVLIKGKREVRKRAALYRLTDKGFVRVDDQPILRDVTGQIIKHKCALAFFAPAFDQLLRAGISDADMSQYDLSEVGDMHKGCILKSLAERKVKVFKYNLYRSVLIAVGGQGHTDVFGADVLEADVQERSVVLPGLVAGIVEVQKAVGAVDLTVADSDVGAGVCDNGGVIGIISENTEHIIALVLLHRGGIICQYAAFLFFLGHRAAEEIFCRRKDMTVGDKYIRTAEAERRAGGVDLTIRYEHISVVEAGNAVITGVEAAVLDNDIFTGGDMHAVVSGQTGEVVHTDIGAVGYAVCPVAGILRCVAGKSETVTIDGGNAVRAAIVFLAVRIVAVPAVNDGAFFADDRRIVGAIYTDEGVVPPTSLCFEEGESRVVICTEPSVVTDLGRINGLHRVLFEDKVCLRVTAAFENTVLQQMQGGIGAQPQSADTVIARRDGDFSAAREKAGIQRFLDIYILIGTAVRHCAVIGNRKNIFFKHESLRLNRLNISETIIPQMFAGCKKNIFSAYR